MLPLTARTSRTRPWGSQGDLDCIEDIFDSEYVGYDPTADPPVVRGPDGFREQTRGYRSVFLDLQFSIRSLVAEGDEVIVRWAATGTHRHSLMGEPPTGRRIEKTGFGSWTFRDEKVVEHWGLIDLPRSPNGRDQARPPLLAGSARSAG